MYRFEVTIVDLKYAQSRVNVLGYNFIENEHIFNVN